MTSKTRLVGMLIAVDGTGGRCVSSCGTPANLDVFRRALGCTECQSSKVLCPCWQAPFRGEHQSIASAQDFVKTEPVVEEESFNPGDGKGDLPSLQDTPNVQQRKPDHLQEGYRCRYCPYFSNRAPNLKMHERTHVGKPFCCRYCHRAFAERSSLENHERIHIGEKPHKCQVCQKSFWGKSHLVEHLRIHTGERPYVCGVCGSAFTQKATLRKHERTHTGERPHTCETCGRSFSERCILSVHQKRHHT